MLTKVLFICLDAAERDLVLKWADAGILPNIAGLRERSFWGDAPALPGLGSGALWPSFSTGVNPSRHGRFFSTHMRPGTYEIFKYQSDAGSWNPFWRTLSQAGRRVAAINVPKDLLCKDMNGLHIVDWGVHDYQFPRAQVWPPREAEDFNQRYGNDPPFKYCDHYGCDEPDMRAFRQQLLRRITTEGELACRYLDRGGWDLFLMTFDEAHCAGHRTWHLHDPAHPLYDPEMAAKIGDPVKESYVAMDAEIGKLLERAAPDTAVILLVGTGMGPNYGGNHILDSILSRLEGDRPSLGKILAKPARKIWTTLLPSNVRARYRSKAIRVQQTLMKSDWENRTAFAVPHNDISGAIRLNMVGREPNGKISPGPEFDEVCSQLARDLMEVQNVDTGKPLVGQVVKTADLYRGEHVRDFADLFVIWDRTGPVNSVTSPKIGTISSNFRGTRTGDHTPHGMFMASMPGLATGRREEPVSILDFAPTIASLLSVELPEVEGSPIPEIANAHVESEATIA